MSKHDPIKVYVDHGAFHTGAPMASVGREDGTETIRIRPCGINGPYMSMAPDAWDALVATVAEARAEHDKTCYPAVPSALLGRTQASS